MAASHKNGTQAEAQRSQPYHKPRSVEELTARNVDVVARLDEASKTKRTPTDCMVDAITEFCGRMTFVWVHLFWFGGWIIVNLARTGRHFDPYPFQFLTLVVSLEAIFLSAFILISQNRQGRLAERRNHLDLQINLLSEQENTKILKMLEAITQHLQIPDGDPEVGILEEATQPERLVEQIEQAIQKESRSSQGRGGLHL